MNIVKLKNQVEKAVARASFNLRPDVKKLLKRAYRFEKNTRARKALGWILENARIAEKEKLAICQDTGLPIIFIEAGKDVNLSGRLIREIEKAVESGYRKNCLRPSSTEPLIRKASYQGVIFHVEFSNAKGLWITIFPKGFGSENKSQLKMFKPTVSIAEIEEFVVSAAKEAGPESCPPFIVGVGIGGTSDKALLLAKKALIGKVDRPNSDKVLNGLEKRLFKKINSLNIGPMGFSGKTTCLSVKVKKAPTHIAGLPVGVNISCHALRSATIKV
ncbi:MAG: fumarate hydratase [Candidatus Omnitrophica bacterium]|nr:fumarate hydratase [Candidatus Omnitrophota bacterium]MBU2251212.1 fumarate hydratase [Candidatus Omnitrophota bacterium]MBU2473176.1 fumarate hydratase [Candidatus Omnitrophota bacterium]